MTQPSLDFTAPRETPRPTRKRRPSLTDKLEHFLLARAGQWVAVAWMAEEVGHSGVRQRRLECEQRGVVLQKDATGHGEYRFGHYGFVVLGRKAESQREKVA